MEPTGRIGTIEATDERGQIRPFLRLSECAQLLGLGRSTLYRWAHEGRVPVVHRSGGMYVPARALAAFIEAEAEAAIDNLATGGHRAANEARTNEGPAPVTTTRRRPGKDSHGKQ
jgi:excisionase family DNA binding protein